MTIEPGWTVDTLRVHLDERADWQARIAEERDRRYAEVAEERGKALKIKETADLAALELARQIQTYKDSKANELREQIGSERGLYATKEDLAGAIREFKAEVTGSRGALIGWLVAAVMVAGVLISATIALAG